MKDYTNPIRRVVGALIMLGAVAAHAQVGGSGTEPSAPASSIADKKAMRVENRKLQRAVMRILSGTKRLNASNILVAARSGVVTLAGSVPETAQIGLAVSVVKGVNGVSEVKNDLTVRPEGQ